MATDKDNKHEAEERISALLEELMDLIKPTTDCGDPKCEADHNHVPDGPWMISGWALGIDLSAESKDDDYEVETWSITLRSRGLPRTQCIGIGHSLVQWAGG